MKKTNKKSVKKKENKFFNKEMNNFDQISFLNLGSDIKVSVYEKEYSLGNQQIIRIRLENKTVAEIKEALRHL